MQSFISKMSLCQLLWLKQTMNFWVEDQKIFSTSFFDRDTVTSSPISLTTTPLPTEVSKTQKKFKRTEKKCLKRKTTDSRRFVPCFGFSTLVRRMRGGLWITPPGFFLSKNQSHPALYYTTRCFFSVSIFPNYHLNSKSPSKIIFDISASYSG